jgi:hypothetical protein
MPWTLLARSGNRCASEIATRIKSIVSPVKAHSNNVAPKLVRRSSIVVPAGAWPSNLAVTLATLRITTAVKSATLLGKRA